MSSEVLVGLDILAHQKAIEFSERHHDRSGHARQVYLNTLSLFAVYDYLCSQAAFNPSLTIQPTFEQSDSWKSIEQALLDVADLTLVNEQGTSCGKVECRPVLSEDQFMRVPAETWGERLLYIAVRLNTAPESGIDITAKKTMEQLRSLQTATILGFVEEVTAEQVSLTQLKPPSLLWKHLHQCLAPLPMKHPTPLLRWLQGIFEEGWQQVEELLDPPTLKPAFRYGSRQSMEEQIPEDLNLPQGAFRQGKLLHLQPEPITSRVVLLISLMPDSQQEVNIWVEVRPPKEQIFLPSDLKLSVLDAMGQLIRQEQTRVNQSFLRFSLSGEPGEKFSVQITFGETQITETFLV